MSVPMSDIAPSNKTERRPGEFSRDGVEGPPYVSDPSGAVVKAKPKAGEQPKKKMLKYSRASSYGKQIENTTNLEKWMQRQIALGIGTAPELAGMCVDLVGGDREDKDWRATADKIIVGAIEASRANIAAERGTFTHAIVEDAILGRHPGLRAIAGELLDLTVDMQLDLLDAFHRCMTDNGIEVLAAELNVVNDEFRCAGKFDLVARLTRDLRFRLVTGEIRVVPAGTVICLDNKTGRLRRDGVAEDGPPVYWESYGVQVYLYASSMLYDTETDERAPMPWPIDQQHGIIVHLDNLSALAGKAKCELVYLDLQLGREGCLAVQQAKRYLSNKTIFSVCQIGDEPAAEAIPDEPMLVSQAIDEMFADVPTVAGEASMTEKIKAAKAQLAADKQRAQSALEATRVMIADVAERVVVTDEKRYGTGPFDDGPNPNAEPIDDDDIARSQALLDAAIVDNTMDKTSLDSPAIVPSPAETPILEVDNTPAIYVPDEDAEDVRADAIMAEVMAGFAAKRAVVQAKIDALKEASITHAKMLAGTLNAEGIPTLKQSDEHSEAQLDRIDAIVMRLAGEAGIPFGPPFDQPAPPVDKPQPVVEPVPENPTGRWLRAEQRKRAQSIAQADIKRAVGRHTIEEGDDLGDDDARAINDAYKALPAETKARIVAWKQAAANAGLGVALNEQRTVRRFEITRSMMAAAALWEATPDGEANDADDLLRLAIEVVTGEQFARQYSIPLGACFGALGIDEAQRFTLLSYELLAVIPEMGDEPSIPPAVATRYQPAA